MSEVLLVEATEELQSLATGLEDAGFHVTACALGEAGDHLSDGDLINVLLLSMIDEPDPVAVRDLLRADRLSPRSAVLAIVRSEQLAALDPALSLDGFIVLRASPEEAIWRMQRPLRSKAADVTSNPVH